jgi:hypothetical protein
LHLVFCFHENLHGRKSLSVFQDIAQIKSLNSLPVAVGLINSNIPLYLTPWSPSNSNIPLYLTPWSPRGSERKFETLRREGTWGKGRERKENRNKKSLNLPSGEGPEALSWT